MKSRKRRLRREIRRRCKTTIDDTLAEYIAVVLERFFTDQLPVEEMLENNIVKTILDTAIELGHAKMERHAGGEQKYSSTRKIVQDWEQSIFDALELPHLSPL